MEEEKNNRERTVYKKVKDKYVFFIIIIYSFCSQNAQWHCSVRGCPLSALQVSAGTIMEWSPAQATGQEVEKLQVQSVGEADCEYKAVYPRIISWQP